MLAFLYSGEFVKNFSIQGTQWDTVVICETFKLWNTQLEEELETYDDHVNNSFKHTWWEDEGRKRNVYFEAPSSAIDANTTFSVRNSLTFWKLSLAFDWNDIQHWTVNCLFYFSVCGITYLFWCKCTKDTRWNIYDLLLEKVD